MQKPTKYFDKRTMYRYENKNILETKEVQAYMKALPDESNNAEWIQADVHDTFLGDESDDSERGV